MDRVGRKRKNGCCESPEFPSCPWVYGLLLVWGVSRIQMILSTSTLGPQGDVRGSWGLRRRSGGSARPHRSSSLCLQPQSRIRASGLTRTEHATIALAMATHGNALKSGWR